MMSSDGSVTSSSASRIRQFGLYRTIDARTEEFLRLSRKRQIRQGCACAAVATAITVTVVVSVLLVYEYSIASESNKNKNYAIKPNWFGLINDSADDTLYESKLSRNKLNIDKTTLKLLPIIIKALNRNRFIEKIIEDHSSHTPETRDTTEYSLQKNVFTDTKKWFKIQPPRLYAIQYKTSPVIYYRSPTKNTEYFTKNRKIRDYQRILNYFDKMISEKVGYGATSPMMKGGIPQTNRPPLISTTVPIKKHYNLKTIKHTVKNTKKNVKKSAKEDNCKCPRKLGDLLGRLITNINQIIPYMSKLPLCKDRESLILTKLYTSSTQTPNIKTSSNKPIETITTPKYVMTTENKVILHLGDSLIEDKINKNLEGKVFNFPLSYNSNLKTNHNTFDLTTDTLRIFDKPITASQKNVIDPTDYQETPQTTTTPMQTINTDTIGKFVYHATKEHQSENSVMDTSTEHTKEIFLSNEEYEDYFATTPNVINYFEIISNNFVHNLKRMKNKNMLSSKKHGSVLRKHKDMYTLKNTKNMPKGSVVPLHPFTNDIGSHPELRENYNNLLSTLKYKQTTSLPENNKSTTQMIRTERNKINDTNQNYKETFKLEELHNNTFDDETEKVLPEEQFQDDEEIKQADNSQIISKQNSSGIIENSNVESMKSYNAWKITKLPEIIIPKSSKSMLPENRPLYLEIHRNDWRQDDRLDFDMNINNNVFDLPTI